MAKRLKANEQRAGKWQPVKKYALAVINVRSAGQIIFGRIVDLSLDGLCFNYLDGLSFNYIENVPHQDGARPDRPCSENETLDIVCSSHDFVLTDLSVLPVFDHETVPPPVGWPVGRWRRRCVKFGNLTQDQSANLKRFIQINGENRCVPWSF
jgi:hypothetical protein